MTESPHPSRKPSAAKDASDAPAPSGLSGPMLIFITALDTTWRMFVPVLGGTFLGIGIDTLAGIAPAATIIGLILGVILSLVLIVKQLTNVRR